MTKEELILYKPETLSITEVGTLLDLTRTEVKALIRRGIIKQESNEQNVKRKIKFTSVVDFIK